eukprot:CAMPEP_0197641072 /NCGR_PEP_ID=MMETSP1338-20131121/15140_1 /TAXON_ID=43686 ORGANISM="Pelagodinium beii, Strain RCC1491" /NCGR_SAMPLE_ID=MMETSP1338 /ASSEMBLY_ACC=CAM_ASM_000754 /LENGTH=74 /DNA_ID=CAMNT_0043213977 /DNA_START=12 /DNA_END=236 /DNA_ORIENTATION=+
MGAAALSCCNKPQKSDDADDAEDMVSPKGHPQIFGPALLRVSTAVSEAAQTVFEPLIPGKRPPAALLAPDQRAE